MAGGLEGLERNLLSRPGLPFVLLQQSPRHAIRQRILQPVGAALRHHLQRSEHGRSFLSNQVTPIAGPVATQIGAPVAQDLSGRYVNTAQQRARRYRPNATGWAPLGWSEKGRKVAISGVLPRSGLGWLNACDRTVLPTPLRTSLGYFLDLHMGLAKMTSKMLQK